jgi:guanosine-3',5'-bis(diphosphate) 3'-pyrophosphohydrolase
MEDINCWERKFKSCLYSKRLLNKFILLNNKATNKIDIKEVKKSIYYAKKYHGNQKRQSGEPYYSHPLEVAYIISDYLFRTDILVTSILHDTIEDTTLTAEMIKSIFGNLVATQVEDLTRVKKDRKISSAELVELLWQQKKYDVLLIKQFDRLHNMQTIDAKSPEKIRKITKETLSTFVVLSVYLETKDIEEKLVQICTNIANSKLCDGNYQLPFGDDENLLSLLFQNDVIHK